MNNQYKEPEFNIVYTPSQDVLTISGGDDFNMYGDQPNSSYYKNSNWTLEL